MGFHLNIYSFGIRLFLLLQLSIFALPVCALDPWMNWQTFETDHFKIHFVDYNRPWVRQTAKIAEQEYQHLSKAFQWIPKSKIHLVLNDDFDDPNGWARPVPYNLVNLYLTPPIDGELQDFQSWMQILIRHELVHIFHTDKAERVPNNLRMFFGRNLFLFPNLFTPRWLTEGLATHIETNEQLGIGRGQSDYFQMMMREEVRTGLKPLSQVSVSSREWPLNQAYLYGVYFFRFLEDKFGEKRIYDWVEEYSDNIIPYLLSRDTSKIFGYSLSDLWLEFEQHLKAEFRSMGSRHFAADDQRFSGLSDSHRHQSPIFLRSGEIAYLQNDGINPQQVVSVNKQKEINTLFTTNGAAQLREGPAKGIWYRRLEYCTEDQLYYDLYRWDGESETRITECKRLQHFEWVDDKHVLWVRYEGGRPFVELFNVKSNQQKKLWEGKTGDVVGAFSWSSKRRRMIASVMRKNSSRWDLAELVFNDAWKASGWQYVTNSFDIEQTPQYVDHGNAVLFTQSNGGYFDLFVMDLTTGDTKLIKESHTGLFSARMRESRHDLVALLYDQQGFQVVHFAADEYQNTPSKSTSINDPEHQKNIRSSQLNTQNGQQYDYNPLYSMMPTTWSFFGTESELGVSVTGQDALENHNYFFGVASEGKKDDVHVSASYTFDGKLGGLISHDRILGEEGSLIDYQDDLDAQLFLRWPWVRLNHRLETRIVGVWNQTTIVPKGQRSKIKFNDNLTGYGIRWSNTKGYLHSAGKVKGGFVQYKLEDRHLLENTNFSGYRQQIDLGWNFQPFEYHGLHLKGYYAVADPDAPRYQLGGSTSEVFASLDPFEFDRDKFKLRGYPNKPVNGEELTFGRASWQFPGWDIERTWIIVPLGLVKVSPNLFYEYGAVGDFNKDNAWTGREAVGAGVNFELSLGYNLVLPIDAYYAKGLSEGGESELGLYFNLEL